MSGQAEPGSSVTVAFKVGGSVVETLTVNTLANGSWSATATTLGTQPDQSNIGYQISVTDAAGNLQTAPALTGSFILDKINPTVTITDNISGVASDNASVVHYTVTFSEAVTDFTAGDLVVTGGSVSNFAVSGSAYTFDVQAPDNSTTPINVNIAQGAAKDLAGNLSVAASATQLVDRVNPTVTITDNISGVASDNASVVTTR